MHAETHLIGFEKALMRVMCQGRISFSFFFLSLVIVFKCKFGYNHLKMLLGSLSIYEIR